MSQESQKSQMSCPLWLLLLLLIGAALLYLVYSQASTKKALEIQQDIESRAISNISGNDKLGAISVRADGRDLLLSGTVTNENERQLATQIASETIGVRQVTEDIAIQQATDQVPEPVVTEEIKQIEVMAKVEPLPEKFQPLPEEELTTKDEEVALVEEKLKQLDFSSITFQKNSSSLTAQAKETLNTAVNTLADNPGTRIRIEGHTDSSGNPELNLSISKQRAQSVLDYLVSSGIDSSRIEADGFGDQFPIAPNDTAAGRIKNRRIEIKAINGE